MPRADLPSPDQRRRKSRRRGSPSWPFPDPLRHGRPRPGRDRDTGGVPVDPNRPLDLSGGAAAALEFDDE